MPVCHGRIVTPIFREISASSLAHLGSGILIEAPGPTYWLVSAAHVLAEQEFAKLVVAASEQLYGYLYGTVYSSCELTVAETLRDEKDVALLQLETVTKDWLLSAGFSFLPFDLVAAAPAPTESHACVLAGYPENSVEIFDGRPLAIRELQAHSTLLGNDELTRRFKLSPRLHVAAPYHQFHDANGAKLKTPHPAGMSGGAIWTLATELPKLIGILTAFDPKHRALIGTSMLPVIRKIATLLNVH